MIGYRLPSNAVTLDMALPPFKHAECPVTMLNSLVERVVYMVKKARESREKGIRKTTLHFNRNSSDVAF